MSIESPLGRWCPTLDPVYGSFVLTDLVGGVGNFTLPSNTYWATDGSFRHLNWSVDWSTSRTPGPQQSSANSFSWSYWMNLTSGVQSSMLRSSQSSWWGWHANRSVRNNDFSANYSSVLATPAGEWVHVCLRQSAGSHMKYSVNGVHAANSVSLSTLTGFTDFRLTLGGSHRSATVDNYFRGQQDDWIFYNSYISDADVERIHSLGRGATLTDSVETATTLRRQSAQTIIRGAF